MNLLDIDNLIKEFLLSYNKGIRTMYKVHCPGADQLSFDAFIKELTEELRTGCVTYVNNHDSVTELFPYLFYITNSFAKRNSTKIPKKNTQYICPGCLYFGKYNLVHFNGNILVCNDCKKNIKSNNLSEEFFYKTFYAHNKSGYKCPDCNRFIPSPLCAGTTTVTCPYFDCCFVGEILNLKKMNHPTTKSNIEKLTDMDNLSTDDKSSLSQLEEKEDLENKFSLLKEIIESQNNSAAYSGSNFTLVHKNASYQAIANILNKFPSEMIDYLLSNSRSGGFQSKLFQEYVSILEKMLPYSYKKGGKVYSVTSLLDENLNIFDGISSFEAIVSPSMEIKNNTKEFYIGGRGASYTKPFYIGKILNITDDNKNSLMAFIKEYSFLKIKLNDVTPGTKVIVTHLRVPPHYQMGGMSYINRARKKIVDRARSILEKPI